MTNPIVDSQLYENASVFLDGSGNGVTRISPYGARNSGLSWDVDAVAVSVATNNLEAQCSVYVSYGIYEADATTLVGTTITGSTGDTCGVGQTVRPGDWIIAAWTGGDPGAYATMRVTGTISPPGVAYAQASGS